MSFVKYTDPHRATHGANQSESSKLTLTAEKAVFSGYQPYTLHPDGTVVFARHKQNRQWNLLSSLRLEGESIADLGCSNGGLGFAMAKHFGFKSLSLLDHDAECVANLEQCKHWFTGTPFETQIQRFTFGEDTLANYDILMTLSTIHWFYSATASFGCLFAIIKELAEHTNRALIIEWIDPSDVAIGILNHLSFNSQVHKTPYTKENFLQALAINFKSFEKIDTTTPTRELYIAYK
jgi:hypothetical protein